MLFNFVLITATVLVIEQVRWSRTIFPLEMWWSRGFKKNMNKVFQNEVLE